MNCSEDELSSHKGKVDPQASQMMMLQQALKNIIQFFVMLGKSSLATQTLTDQYYLPLPW